MRQGQALKPLDAEQRASLDAGLLKYLKRERKPVREYSVLCHAELHTTDEIVASLSRLRRRNEVEKTIDPSLGTMWCARTTEDECRACELLRTTYKNPENVVHTCRPMLPSSGTGPSSSQGATEKK